MTVVDYYKMWVKLGGDKEHSRRVKLMAEFFINDQVFNDGVKSVYDEMIKFYVENSL